MTRAELDASNAQNILGEGLVTKMRHSAHNTAIANYIDDKTANVSQDKYKEYITQESGNSITDSDLVGREVYMIVLDDLTKNKGFTKPINSDTFSFTDEDGTTFNSGQKLTLLLK